MDTILSESIGFNPSPPTLMHIDLNSCFATVEQQANPLLRGKPVAVAAYTSPGGCILAASREAKVLGVKTGMRVRDGRVLCPSLIVLPSDPNKYRYVNRKLLALFREYTEDVEVKSIDEMVLNFARSAVLQPVLSSNSGIFSAPAGKIQNSNAKCQSKFKDQSSKIAGNAGISDFELDLSFELGNLNFPSSVNQNVCRLMVTIGQQIKRRIKSEIGDWLTVSIGIAPNRFLAKTGSNLHKPDGLDVITGENIEAVLSAMQVEDLCGIKEGYGTRLRSCGIGTAIAFYKAPIRTLKAAFRSVVGYHWWLRLHGWEADDRQFPRRSFGHSYALYKSYTTRDTKLSQILCQLTEKMARRLRRHGYRAGGIHVACFFADRTFWHHGEKFREPLFAGPDLYRAALRVLAGSPDKPVRILAVSCSYLTVDLYLQTTMDEMKEKSERITRAIDKITERWGDAAIFPARILSTDQKIKDRIAFGGVKELEEFVFRENIDRTSW